MVGEDRRETIETPSGTFHRVPLNLPPKSTGKPFMAEAIRHMTMIIRTRQNTIADFSDLEQEYYDWKGELSKRWYPCNGIYRPQVQYRGPD